MRCPDVQFPASIPRSRQTIKKLVTSFFIVAVSVCTEALIAHQSPGGSAGTGTRVVTVMDYSALSAPLTVAFRYTSLAPGAAGQAEIEPARFALRIHAAFSKLPPASRLGTEYLTYVLWAVTPEGLASNLGEIQLIGTDGKLNTKMVPSRFGLIVTAEPYFAVSHPSNAVVFEADLAPGTKPAVPVSHANCQLLTAPLGADLAGSAPPAATDAALLLIEEARRAITVAKKAGAQQFAPETLATAEHLLQLAKDQQARGTPRKDVIDTGSEAVLIAEDARVLAVRRQNRTPQTTAGSDCR